MAEASTPKVDLLWVLGVFVVVGILWFASGGPDRAGVVAPPLISSPFSGDGNRVSGNYLQSERRVGASADLRATKSRGAGVATSPYAGAVKLGAGNARSEDRPQAEYLTLELSRRSPDPVSLAGWRLSGDRSAQRPVAYSNRLVYSRGYTAVLPSQAGSISPNGQSLSVPVVLAPGDRAILVSGRPIRRSQSPITTSFRVNKCLGYVQANSNTANLFTPKLTNRCPDPELEPGIERIDRACFDFVEDLRSCHVPEFKNYREEPLTVDGRAGLSASCRAFLKNQFSYQGCLRTHAGDEDFLLPEWRLYLNQDHSLWSRRDETITLYDQNGLIVDQLKY